MFALMVQEPLLALQAATVAGKAAVLSYHPVARYDDSNTVLTIGPSDSSYSGFIAQEYGLLFVRSGFAIGNMRQALPDTFLEFGAYEMQGNIKNLPDAAKVLTYLLLKNWK